MIYWSLIGLSRCHSWLDLRMYIVDTCAVYLLAEYIYFLNVFICCRIPHTVSSFTRSLSPPTEAATEGTHVSPEGTTSGSHRRRGHRTHKTD